MGFYLMAQLISKIEKNEQVLINSRDSIRLIHKTSLNFSHCLSWLLLCTLSITFILAPVFSTSQNASLFNLCREEMIKQLNRGNSTPLSLVPFGGLLPLKHKGTPKFGTFILYCKSHRGPEGQLLDLVGTNNGSCPVVEKEHVNREEMEAFLAESHDYIRENSDFVERNGKIGAINANGFRKVAMNSSINANCEKFNLDLGTRPGNLRIVDYVKNIVSLPIEERVKVLDLLQCDNRCLTISDYNDILNALLRAEEFDQVIRFFSELEQNGIEPDLQSFSILVHCFCKKKNPFEAKRVLDGMLQNGLKPNIVTFTSVIQSLCKRGRVTMALEVFDKMSKASLEPTIHIYNALIVGLCYVGRLEDALDELNNLKSSPTKPDIYTYTVVIGSYCRVGKIDEAVQLFNDAKEMGLKPTIITYSALLNGFCRESRTVEAISLLKEMQARGTMPDLICYNIVLRGLLTNRQYSLVWKMYKRMREAGFQLGKRTMNAVLRALCRLSLTNKTFLEDAKELFKMIVELQFGPSTYTYCLLIQALARAGEVEPAVVHLHNMVNTGLPPRMLTFNMVIRVLCREGRVYDAQGVVVAMIKLGKLPSMFSFEIILNEFSKQSKVSDALALYGAAIKLRIDPKWKLKDVLKCKTDSDGTLKKKKTE